MDNSTISSLLTNAPLFASFVGALFVVFNWLSTFLKSRDELSQKMMMETMSKFENVAREHKTAIEKIVESHDRTFTHISTELKENTKILTENHILMKGMIGVMTSQYGEKKVRDYLQKAVDKEN